LPTAAAQMNITTNGVMIAMASKDEMELIWR
jgi:hypothetical protein